MKPREASDPGAKVVPLGRVSMRRSQLEFLPAVLEVMETPASPLRRVVAAIIILFFASAVAWATLGKVDIIATAQGKIVPTGRTKTIQPLEAGIVTAIHVRDGDHVKAGQVLVELDRTVTTAERDRTKHDLVEAELDRARLWALRDALNSGSETLAFTPPADASAAEVNRTRDAMRAQQAAQNAKLAMIDRQIAQKNGEAEETDATIDKLEASLPLVQEEADVRRKARQLEYGNRIADLEAQTRLVEQQHELLVQRQHAATTEESRQALVRQREQAVAEYAGGILSDLSEAVQKVAQLEQDLVKAEEKLDERYLRSPVEGTVQQLALHTIGGVVTPAQELMMIVPIDSHLEAEAMVSNHDIGFVHVAQPAEVKIDTFNFTLYGLLHGSVVNVSSDAIVRDKPPAQKSAGGERRGGQLGDSSEPEGQELLYAARVSLDRTQMQVEGKAVDLEPGMAVTVEIKTGTRRVIEYLLSPLLRYRHESLHER
jgi:hemolysin D